jgi:pimeloyl-ACP methyl ester carboxylesterase
MAKHDPIVGRYVYVRHAGEEYRTYYEENGEGIPLVCLHTAGTDGREWRHQLCDPDITKNFRVIAFDLPRHGKSIPPPDFYKEEEEYKLTSKFYSEFIVAFCKALDLKKPVIMGSSMGGNICLPLALNFENEFTALIAVEACDYSPGWWIDPLHNPHIHGGEVCATSVFGLMAPQSPDKYRWETWWFYAQGGPGIFKGDLHFYSVDHDFRDLCRKISGKVPMYLMTGVYDFACTPEMTKQTAEKIKNVECIIMEGIGHFPMSENPEVFKEYLMPVLKKIAQLDAERRGSSEREPSRSTTRLDEEKENTHARAAPEVGYIKIVDFDEQDRIQRERQRDPARRDIKVVDFDAPGGKPTQR